MSTSLPEKTMVLIVGAGPAGLSTALSLYHRGVHDFIIVDAVSQGNKTSRAIVVHAATVEALDSIGCGDDLVSQGMKTTVYTVGTRSTNLIGPDVESLKPYTRHPYILVVPQPIIERVLEDKLASFGVTVHRPLEVVGLKQNADDTQLTDATFEDGMVITARYVVGADGPRSVVRTTAGIGFSDPMTAIQEQESTLAQMIIADVTFDGIEPDDTSLTNHVSSESFFICFPLPLSFNEHLAANGESSVSNRIYRISSGVPLEEGEIPQPPSKEYLQSLIDRFGPYHLSSDPSVNPNSKPTYVKDILWSSRFRSGAAIADTTFMRLCSGTSGEGGPIVLVGDAAHIHPPVGGQGVNLGIRDAIFLGEALMKHIKASETQPFVEADEILHEFAKTRHERALGVIRLSKRFLAVVGMKHRDWMYWWLPISSDTVRAWALWILGSMPFVTRKMAWELSGLGRR